MWYILLFVPFHRWKNGGAEKARICVTSSMLLTLCWHQSPILLWTEWDVYEEFSAVHSIQHSTNDNHTNYVCLMDGSIPNDVISQFIGVDALNEEWGYYVMLSLQIIMPSPRRAFWIPKSHFSHNQHDTFIARFPPWALSWFLQQKCSHFGCTCFCIRLSLLVQWLYLLFHTTRTQSEDSLLLTDWYVLFNAQQETWEFVLEPGS